MKICDKTNEQLTAFVLGYFSEEEVSDMTRHLVECEDCRVKVREHGKLLECAREISEISADEQMCKSAKEAVLAVAEGAEKARPRPIINIQNIGRIIMKSRITKLSAVAAIMIIVIFVGWLSSNPDSNGQISSFALLSRAYAAEQTLFCNAGITHIANEIILYPEPESDAGQLLSDLESEVTQDRNIAFIKNWLSHRWLPVYSLTADGRPREHELELTKFTDKAIIVSDLAWYDSATGQFARVLKTDDQMLFANSYDGDFIYTKWKDSKGKLQIDIEAITEEFQVPDNPADFLGIAAGIKGSVPREHYPPIQDVITETLKDGTPVRAYKLGFADPWENVDTYFVFKINTHADIIDEIECVVEGRTTRVHRRVVAETVDSPEFSWNLAELSADEMVAGVKVDAGEGVNIVTVQQMAQRATSAVYVFARDPSWTNQRTIYDLPDEASTPARFFCATYRAKDGRDIVLTQGESFNRYFVAILKKFNEVGKSAPWTYVSENGFKALHQDDKEGEMWWTEFALKSSGFEPSANRVGYILMSPENIFMVLAINGPISARELQGLVDSLVPADEYVPNPAQP